MPLAEPAGAGDSGCAGFPGADVIGEIDGIIGAMLVAGSDVKGASCDVNGCSVNAGAMIPVPDSCSITGKNKLSEALISEATGTGT